MAQLEARLARIEARLGLETASERADVAMTQSAPAGDGHTSQDFAPVSAVQLEQQVEQGGFALAGVIALTIGVGFMLSLPYPRLPAAVPALLGATLAAGLLAAAHFGPRGFGALALQVRGAAMVLLFLATLRLFFFARPVALDLATPLGRTLLMLTVAINATVAWRQRSPWLVLLALVMGCAAVIAINAGWCTALALPLLAAGAVFAAHRGGWPAVGLAAIPLVYATYLTWAVGNPFRGGRFHYAAEPAAAPGLLLLALGIFAAGGLYRRQRDHEDGPTNTAALLNCILGYGCFLVHTAAAYPAGFAALHVAAFGALLGLAALFWLRERSRVSTFFYAMTAYAALSMAIVKASPAPEVFVWLSLQSVVVVTTAIWFRSRLIVVANFLIYAGIVLGYMAMTKRETGISLGFGVVALLSARILNWQRDRLELKTELMRNAYLLSAFIVFPYALYHLVPVRFVALAWVGLAVGYYGMNLLVQKQKYRWMGHATLGLAALFLLLIGSGRLDPVYRVASFLALGSVLLIASLASARAGRRAEAHAGTHPGAPDGAPAHTDTSSHPPTAHVT